VPSSFRREIQLPLTEEQFFAESSQSLKINADNLYQKRESFNQ
jgi:hypothetical protein